MLNLYYDHAYRIMNKEEYLFLKKLGFEVFPDYTVAHEGTLSRFIYFKKNVSVSGTLPYHYLEFLEVVNSSKITNSEGLSFATDDFSRFEKGVEGFKVSHKNYDWQMMRLTHLALRLELCRQN